MNTQDIERVIQLAKAKLKYKDPNVSLSIDEARFADKYLVSVGSYGLYMSAKADSFEEAFRVLIESLESAK